MNRIGMIARIIVTAWMLGEMMADRVEQDHRRQDGLRQRQHDPDEDAEPAEPVDLSGLLELARQALEERLRRRGPAVIGGPRH
jgi:hypothetical protein